MFHRLIPFLLFIAVIVFVFSNFHSLKRDFVYKLGLANDPSTSCCTEEQALTSNGEFDENASTAIFNNELIDYPKTSLAYSYYKSAGGETDQEVLGTTTSSGEEKWIEISLDEQRLRAWEGNKVVIEYPISSGKWSPTPKGTFNIWYKTRAQVMSGGSKELGTYYYLPNVPHNMFFYKGYAIHGAYWHNNFGQPMSHGCVNEPLNYAAQIFDWAGPVVPEGQNVVRATAENPGTRVYVH
jgi:hypothetical protein